MARLTASLTRCDLCGTQTNVDSTFCQEDAAKVRRHKCPTCGNVMFSAQVLINKEHVACSHKKYQLRLSKLRQLIEASHA